ncbi:CPBP family intramembrane glutamic endopeptidase [Enterobacteriaceae bacterium C34A]
MEKSESENIYQYSGFSKNTLILLIIFSLSVGITGLPLLLYPKFMGVDYAFSVMFMAEFILGGITYYIYFKRSDAFPEINKGILVKSILIILSIQLLMYFSGPHNIGSMKFTLANTLSLAMLIVLIPFYEEVFYRGCLLDILFSIFKGQRYFPYVINSAVFCLMHTQYHRVSEYFVLFVVSLIFTHVRVKSNSIIHSVIAHSSMNAFVVIINMKVFF